MWPKLPQSHVLYVDLRVAVTMHCLIKCAKMHPPRSCLKTQV